MLNSKISKAVRLALMYGAVSATAFAVNAEESEENIEKIEVTGSSIKGTDLAGALPVDIISAEDIKNTGVTSVGDLVAQIPSMQGFTTPVSSVGGGGTGQATASLRGIGEEYTLVLLNGRRIAPMDSTNTVDLNSIPLAAIERVEVLTDGASALYGSDAIAGVINFILKDEVDQSTVSVRADRPSDGGDSYNISFTTGFGDLDRDGFSIVASISHDKVETLRSKDRDFAKTGFLEFEVDGNQYWDLNGSPNAIPAIAYVDIGGRDEEGRLLEGSYVKAFSPYHAKNGQCAPDTAPEPESNEHGADCWFDFTSTLEIFPENERTAFVLQGDFAVSDNLTAFSTLTYTDFTMTSRIAPRPTGQFSLGAINSATAADSVLYTNYVKEHLTAEEQAKATAMTASWRALPGGNRTNQYDNSAINLIVGLEGTLLDDIDFNTAVVYSSSSREDTIKNGQFDRAKFAPTVATGAIDVFATPEEFEQNEAAKEAMESVQWRGLWDTTETEMLSFDFRASQPVFELPAGEVYVGYGVDYRENEYRLIRTDAQINRLSTAPAADVDYDLSRSQYGAFAEFQVPVLEDLSANLAVRYDNIGKVETGTPDGNTYKSANDTTYKLSLRYNASDNLVLRGSIGTGFKVGSLRSFAQPLSSQGVTGGNFTCPNLGDPSREGFCPPGRTQYQLFLAGNPELAPEESEQTSLGFVYSPTSDTTIQLDYWSVEIEGKAEIPDPAYIFANVNQFNQDFVVHTNRSDDNLKLLSLERTYLNLGKTETSGIDWRFEFNNELSFGQLKTTLQGTHIIESQYTAPGVVPFEWESSLGKYGSDEEVVFRNVANIQNTLIHGDFSHSLRFTYKSGYQDDRVVVNRGTIENPVTEIVYNEEGVGSVEFEREHVQLSIPSYVKADYKIDYLGFENTVITFGVNNLFDKAPPFSLGDPEGHIVGYEGRYYDQLLRTYYLSVDYSF